MVYKIKVIFADGKNLLLETGHQSVEAAIAKAQSTSRMWGELGAVSVDIVEVDR